MEWPTIKLGDISEVITKGTTPTSVGFEFTASGVNFVKIESISLDGDFIPSKFAAVSNECHESLKRSQLKEGDILFSIAGALGRTALVTQKILPANTNQALAIIRIKKDVLIDKRYLILALKTGFTLEQIEKHQGGVAQQNLSLGQMKTFEIPLPPIPEQQRIVAILDQAFADIEKARASAEKNLKNARELFDSYLNRAFDENKTNWPIMDLGQIAEVKGGKRLPKGYRPTIEKTKYPYVRVADFDNKGSVNLVGMRYISEEVHNKIKRYTISSKDVFITIVGATIGKSGIVPKELNGANLTENACKLVLGSNMSNKFIYYFTITKTFYEQVGLNTRTAAQPKLALERLKTINLAIPPIDVQETLSAKFNAVWLEAQRLDMIYQRKIASLDELKKSLLQKAFSGELTKTEDMVA
jgi:type I restriction enzyme S subunit